MEASPNILPGFLRFSLCWFYSDSVANTMDFIGNHHAHTQLNQDNNKKQKNHQRNKFEQLK